MSRFQEKIESALFLREVAEAIRRYRTEAPAAGVAAEPAPRPPGVPERLAERLKRLARR